MLSGFGRYSQPALLVLMSLLDGDKHGYAIAEDIDAMTGDRPGPGTLYGAIARLEERGFIEATDADGRRKPYRLSGKGITEAGLEVRRLHALSREVTRRLGWREALV
jgi:DNA-binding PadR family transcriptional regulator